MSNLTLVCLFRKSSYVVHIYQSFAFSLSCLVVSYSKKLAQDTCCHKLNDLEPILGRSRSDCGSVGLGFAY